MLADRTLRLERIPMQYSLVYMTEKIYERIAKCGSLIGHRANV